MKITTKYFWILSFLAAVFLGACTQDKIVSADPVVKDTMKDLPASDYTATDQSPMDVSYFPKEYPQQKMAKPQMAESPVARIIYSRPHKKDRIIFSEDENSLCPYGKLWRLGANEATEIEFFQPVVIEGKNIPLGRYVMYCIPFKDKWVIAFNSNLYSWGLQIDESKDIVRIEIPTQKQNPPLEDFTMIFQTANYGADLLMAWDDVQAVLPITFSNN